MGNDANLIVGIELDQANINRAINVFGAQVSRSLSTGVNSGLAGLNQWAPVLGRITGKANEFQKSLEASNARVIAFGASAGIIFGLQSAFRKLVSSTIEVEKELTNINALFQLGSGDLAKFSKNLFEVANSTSSMFTDATKAATEFSRQGLGVEEVLKRTASALTLSRLSGLALEDSISSLTATMNSFVRESLTTEDIVNRLTAVDARYAVSAGDLALGLSRVSAAANDAGISLNQTVALITAAQQITARGGSVLGNSFKTIFTRLQRPQILDTLEQTGIAVRDVNGKTKPMIEVLKILSQSYSGLSSSQKSFISETVGGVYQINALKAILQDLGGGLSIVDGALKTAESSAGSAQKRLSELNSTISSSLIRSMNELTRASSNVGTAMIGGTMRSGINSFTKILSGVADSADPSQNGEHSLRNNAAQGALKGIGNVLAGPGLQVAMVGIMKLLTMFGKFAYSAVGSLTLANSKLKDQAEIQKVLAGWLERQPNLLKELALGHTNILDINKQLLNVVRDQAAAFAFTATASKNLATAFTSKGGGISHAAGGYVPSMSDAISESQRARAGGYAPGRVVATTLQDGPRIVPIIANTAETKTRVVRDGQVYETINPPENSYAGRMHKARAPWAYGASGFVSQDLAALPSVIEAINAEKSVVNAAIKIDRNPELVNTLNPQGLGVYNSKQMSLAHAIAQHKKYQSVSEIQSQRTTGHRLIPNLASDFSGGGGSSGMDATFFTSMMMGMMSHISQSVGSPAWLDKLKLSSGRLVDQKEKEIIATRLSIREFANLKNALITGTQSVQWKDPQGKTGTYTSAKALQDAFPNIDAETEKISAYERKRQEQREKTQNRAFKLSMGLGIGGGMATQVVGSNFGATAAEGTDKLTKGLMNAAQIVWAMPGKGGQAAAAGMAGYSTVEALDTWMKGLATAANQFEQLQSRTQKVVAQLDSMAATLNNYDNLLTDSSVSYETLIKEQRKLTELMSQLKGGNEDARGAYVAIAGAGSNTARFAAIDAYKKTQSQNLESQASILDINKRASASSFLGNIYNPNPLGWKTEGEKTQVKEMVNGTSNSFIAEMDDPFKAKALKASSNAASFQSLIGGDKKMQELLSQIENGKVRSTVVERMRVNLGEEASMSTPEGKAAVEKLQKTRAASQAELDMKIHAEAMQKRLFLNQGAYQANNNLDIQEFQTRKNYGSGMQEMAGMQAKGNLYKLQYGDRTNAIYSAKMELSRGEMERKQKVETSRQGTARSVIGGLTQNFDSFLANGEAFKSLNQAGMTAPSISARQFEIRQALNTGIASTMAGRTLERFSDKNGGLDYGKFANEIVKNSGSTDKGVNDTILKYLQNGNSDEILKIAQSGNKDILQINQEQLSQAQQTNENLKGMLEELKFKELSSFMGGMKSLIDRQSRRSMEREGVRGLSLAFGNGNAESRGAGAAGYLKFMQGQGIAIDRKDPMVNALWNIATQGKMAVDYRSTSRIAGITGARFGRGSLPFQGALGYANKNSFGERANAAMLAEFKPENEGILGGASSSSIDASVSNLSREVDIAAAALKSFGASISGSQAAYEQAAKETAATRKKTSETDTAAQRVAEATVKKYSPNRVPDNLSDAEMEKSRRVNGDYKTWDYSGVRGVASSIGGGLAYGIPTAYAIHRLAREKAKIPPANEAPPTSKKALGGDKRSSWMTAEEAAKSGTKLPVSFRAPFHNIAYPKTAAERHAADQLISKQNEDREYKRILQQEKEALNPPKGKPPLIASSTPSADKAFLDHYSGKPPVYNRFPETGGKGGISKKILDALRKGGIRGKTLATLAVLGGAAYSASASEGEDSSPSSLSSILSPSTGGSFTDRMMDTAMDMGKSPGQKYTDKAIDYLRNTAVGETRKNYGETASLGVKYAMDAYNGPVGVGLNLLSDTAGVYSQNKNALSQLAGTEARQRGYLSDDADTVLHSQGKDFLNGSRQFYARISNRTDELNNKRVADEEGSSGIYGRLTSLITPKQFTPESQKELGLLNQRQESLRQSINSGDDAKTAQLITEIKAIFDTLNGKTDKGEATVNSKIDVKISLDSANISDDIQEQFIIPLAEKLMSLEGMVNVLKQGSNATMPPARA
jgi:TP901 family phage tail tape measure protein